MNPLAGFHFTLREAVRNMMPTRFLRNLSSVAPVKRGSACGLNWVRSLTFANNRGVAYSRVVVQFEVSNPSYSFSVARDGPKSKHFSSQSGVLLQSGLHLLCLTCT